MSAHRGNRCAVRLPRKTAGQPTMPCSSFRGSNNTLREIHRAPTRSKALEKTAETPATRPEAVQTSCAGNLQRFPENRKEKYRGQTNSDFPERPPMLHK